MVYMYIYSPRSGAPPRCCAWASNRIFFVCYVSYIVSIIVYCIHSSPSQWRTWSWAWACSPRWATGPSSTSSIWVERAQERKTRYCILFMHYGWCYDTGCYIVLYGAFVHVVDMGGESARARDRILYLNYISLMILWYGVLYSIIRGVHPRRRYGWIEQDTIHISN